ncbi:MAG: FHA domain-containing protein [Planctomycetota bacterium]
MYKFVVIDGPGKGGTGFELKSSPAIIGRGFEAEILLDSQNASRKHACVTLMGDEVFIHTVTDKLDTFVNGKAITRDPRRPVKLRSGDKVQINDVVLELRNQEDEFRQFSTQSSLFANGPVASATPSFPPVEQISVIRPDSDLQALIDAEKESGKKYLQGSPKFAAHRQRLAALEYAAFAQVKASQPGTDLFESQAEIHDVDEPAQDTSNVSNSTPVSRVNRGPLDVYVVLDVSGSMAGEQLEAAISGLQSLITESIDDRSEFLLSLITYGPTARMEFTRTRCHDVRLPHLKAGGFSALGHALQLLSDNVAKGMSGAQSESPDNPLVFLIGDGHGTDEPHKQLVEWRTDASTMLLCVLGPRVPSTSLLNACEFAVNAEKPADYRRTFDWIKAVIRLRTAGDALPTEVGAPLKVIPRPDPRNAR